MRRNRGSTYKILKAMTIGFPRLESEIYRVSGTPWAMFKEYLKAIARGSPTNGPNV